MTSKQIRVAVSLKKEGNSYVLHDDHFGEGDIFRIYSWDLDRDELKLIEERENTSSEERFHGDPQKAQGISQILDDVQVLVGKAFGPNITRMRKRYVPVVTRLNDLEETLERLKGLKERVLENLSKDGDKEILFIK